MENKLHQEQEKVHLAEEKDSKAKRERDALEKSRAKVVKFESALVELGAGTCSFPVTGSRSSCATAAGYPGTDVFSLTALLCLTWQRGIGLMSLFCFLPANAKNVLERANSWFALTHARRALMGRICVEELGPVMSRSVQKKLHPEQLDPLYQISSSCARPLTRKRVA